MSIFNVQIVDAEYVKQNSDIEFNVETRLIDNSIMLSQRIDLLQLIGQELYVEVMTAVSGGTESSNQLTLINDYILPYVTQRAVYHLLPSLHGKIRNSNVVSQNSENSNAIDLQELKYKRDIQANLSQFLGERLVNFLCLNITDYPTYRTVTNKTDLIGRKQSYIGGIVLPDTSQINRNYDDSKNY